MTIHISDKNRLGRLLIVLILLQPLLDVLSFWLNHFGLDNYITLFLRLMLLAATALAGFCLTEHKRVYYITGAVLLIFTLCHAAACIQVGYKSPLTDLTNLVRIYLLPLTTLSFMTFLAAFPNAKDNIDMSFILVLLLIFIIEMLSTATGTDPHTYANKSIGTLGWFYFANSQSAILSMLVPLTIANAARRGPKFWFFGIVSLCGLSMLFALGTRLAYFSLIVTGLVLGIVLLLKTSRSMGIYLLVLTLIFGVLYPVSPMTRNQTLVAENALLKQADIDEMVAADEAAAIQQGLENDDLSLQRLESSYKKYLSGLVGTFGLQRTAKKYNYSTRASDITDARRARITYSKLLLEDSPSLSYVFGMELSRWMYQGTSYDVENDFHGIFFLCGGVGLLLLLLFLGYYVLTVLLGLIHRPKLLLDPAFMALCVAAITCAAHIYATAGVLRRPNASFYLAVVLALLWHNVKSGGEATVRE